MAESCLSRKHAILFLEDGGRYCAIKDLGSVNKVGARGSHLGGRGQRGAAKDPSSSGLDSACILILKPASPPRRLL